MINISSVTLCSRVTGDSDTGEEVENEGETEDEGDETTIRRFLPLVTIKRSCAFVQLSPLARSLSEPTFLPIAGDKTSGTDSEQENAAQRKVRFSRVAEVGWCFLVTMR